MNNYGHFASAAFAFLISIVGVWTGFKQLRNRTLLNSWPTTNGRVIERGTYQPAIAMRSTSAFRHAPLVKYSYQVNAQNFVNDRIHPQRIQQPQHSTQKWAQKRAQTFADEVTVHYNPDDPTESFLIQTPKRILYIVIGASCLAGLFGVVLLVTK